MGETVIEKIIRNNVGKAVKPGDIVTMITLYRQVSWTIPDISMWEMHLQKNTE